MKRQIILAIILTFILFTGFSQTNPSPTENPVSPIENTRRSAVNVFDVIMTSDSLHEGTIRIYQDKQIEQLFFDRITLNNTGVISGYRVQVFSSNAQRTAKNEAFRIESLIREKFPEASIYVSYASPFWKVRIGDFRKKDDAQTLREELMHAFPDMRKEMYVVKDDIIVSSSK